MEDGSNEKYSPYGISKEEFIACMKWIRENDPRTFGEYVVIKSLMEKGLTKEMAYKAIEGTNILDEAEAVFRNEK